MPTYVITGTNRGIGLELVRQLAQSPDNTIFAGVRDINSDIGDLKKAIMIGSGDNTRHIIECDVSSTDSINTFIDVIEKRCSGEKKIDYLINSAGVNIASTHDSLSLIPENVLKQVTINVLGPAQLTAGLLKKGLLSDDVKVLNFTSGLGSMARSAEQNPRKCAGYSISKAGLNMLSVHQAGDLRKELPRSVVALLDPGWVKTRMGGNGATLEVEDSVRDILKVLHGLKEEDNGEFFHHSGDKVPW
ncbi:C-factor [Podospora australis]|uniref:C-factor n=1 Tax=Podospora australis TaxID=1536484 RepID=A0AAN6WMA5_9PEZI|nr:C-factor [Podospora australis]